MSSLRLLKLAGDGIGPEITSCAEAVAVRAAALYNVDVCVEEQTVGLRSLRMHGTTFRDSVLSAARSFDGIILGTQSHAEYPSPEKGGRNISAAFRVGLDLFANIRPVRTYPGVPTQMRAGKTMDLIIAREATEGFYPDRNMFRGWGEVMPTEDVALSIRKITRASCVRIAVSAFELAMQRRKKVTAIHKSNSFHQTDGLFLECFRQVAAQYPHVEADDLLVDAAAAHLVRTPERFDVLLTTNLYGDILSDLASELSGSLGLGGAIMAGASNCCAQAQHGSAPTLEGRNAANPTSMILSVAMLFSHLGVMRSRADLCAVGAAMQRAVTCTLADARYHTADIGGTASCSQFCDAVVAAVAKD